ncbi:MAG: methyltransferase domain-containing protein [Elusimicrobia bacterium]|nr:methyltransferase domain-containing protein [Elusimicrobiota bacterium]
MNCGGIKKTKKASGFVLAALFLLAMLPAALPAIDSDINKVLFPHLFDAKDNLAYLENDPESGWRALAIRDRVTMSLAAAGVLKKNGLIIPILPTVYSPEAAEDKRYYDYILRDSGIKKGDKVLVIGCGSGSDSWAAWLKSSAPVYAIDINPLAVANTRAVAMLAGFPLHSLVGDVNSVSWPKGFSGFDYLLWNMPYLETGGTSSLEENLFHDADRGEVLDKFLVKMPGLLRPGGKAVLLNTSDAVRRMREKNVNIEAIKTGNPGVWVVVFEKKR